MSSTTILTRGSRKYTTLWNKIKEEGYATVKCERKDTVTVMNGVKKEKLQDKKKDKKKLLICTPTDIGVHFKLMQDTSINNL